jgi:hypothetical protein
MKTLANLRKPSAVTCPNCRNGVRTKFKFLAKSLKSLMERVKGIEPSYSAWKAAALPLSYTRVQAINYHAAQAASTAMHDRLRYAALRSAGPLRAARPLNIRRFHGYTGVSINSTKGGDPVSLTKRCHLAGIAR